jgi:NitT/TauT family transport system substrate-binding protein
VRPGRRGRRRRRLRAAGDDEGRDRRASDLERRTFLTQVLGEGAREIEAPLTTLGKRFPNGTYATTEKYLGQNRDVVERFARAMNKSSAYASSHPEEARAMIPKFAKIPPAVAQKIRLPLWPTEIDRGQLQQLANYAVRYKVIKQAPPLDELIWQGAS